MRMAGCWSNRFCDSRLFSKWWWVESNFSDAWAMAWQGIITKAIWWWSSKLLSFNLFLLCLTKSLLSTLFFCFWKWSWPFSFQPFSSVFESWPFSQSLFVMFHVMEDGENMQQPAAVWLHSFCMNFSAKNLFDEASMLAAVSSISRCLCLCCSCCQLGSRTSYKAGWIKICIVDNMSSGSQECKEHLATTKTVDVTKAFAKLVVLFGVNGIWECKVCCLPSSTAQRNKPVVQSSFAWVIMCKMTKRKTQQQDARMVSNCLLTLDLKLDFLAETCKSAPFQQGMHFSKMPPKPINVGNDPHPSSWHRLEEASNFLVDLNNQIIMHVSNKNIPVLIKRSHVKTHQEHLWPLSQPQNKNHSSVENKIWISAQNFCDDQRAASVCHPKCETLKHCWHQTQSALSPMSHFLSPFMKNLEFVLMPWLRDEQL